MLQLKLVTSFLRQHLYQLAPHSVNIRNKKYSKTELSLEKCIFCLRKKSSFSNIINSKYPCISQILVTFTGFPGKFRIWIKFKMCWCTERNSMPIILDSKIQFIVSDVNNLHPSPIHTNSWVHWLLFKVCNLVNISCFFVDLAAIQFQRSNIQLKKSKLGKCFT